MNVTTLSKPGRGKHFRGLPGKDGATIADCIWLRAEREGDRVLYHFPHDGKLTLHTIAEKARKLAASLAKLDLSPGDPIALQLPNCEAAVIINVAAAALGLPLVPIPPNYRVHEIRHILGDARVRLLFARHRAELPENLALLAALRSDLPHLAYVATVGPPSSGLHCYEEMIDAGDVTALTLPLIPGSAKKAILYTAGTSGRSKGVIHSHDSARYSAASSIVPWQLDKGDMMLIGSSIAHVTGFMCGLELPLRSDIALAMLEDWDPKLAVDVVDEYGVTCAVGATPLLATLIDEAERRGSRLPSLRFYACGGVAIPPALIYRAARITERCHPFRVYGATEVPMATKGFIDESDLNLAAETDGRIVNYEIRIISHDGRPVAPGREGEILLRGPGMMLGYTDPDETLATVDEDGFYHTRDIGYLRADGALVVASRSRDLIVRGGEKLSPKEIEEALERHPSVEAAAVVAIPHPSLGEAVCAFLQIREGSVSPSLFEIAAHLDREGLALEKFPERVEYISRLPQTASGKVRKEPLRRAVSLPISLSHVE